MGQADGADLEDAIGRPGYSELREVASVLPLIDVSGDPHSWRFGVHDCARSAFAPDEYLAQMDDVVSGKLVACILRQGDYAAAARVAAATRSATAALSVVLRFGDELIRRGEVDCLARALDVLEPEHIVANPRALLMKASVSLDRNNPADARQSARSVVELARHQGDSTLLVDALLLLAKMSFALGDQQDCVECMEALRLVPGTCADTHRQALALAFSCQASACLLDRDGLTQLREPVDRVLRMDSLDTEAREQLRLSYGISRGLLFGDWMSASRSTDRVRRTPGVGVGLRLLAGVDNAAAVAELGRIEAAEACLREIMAESESAGSTSTYYCAMGTLSSIRATVEPDGDWASLAESSVKGGLASGDVGSSVLNAIYTSTAARACRQFDASLEWAERAEALLEGRRLPVLGLWAQVERTAALFALGDTELAANAAQRLGAAAHAAGARHLSWKLDAIRALSTPINSLGDIDLDWATHEDYLRSESANWQTAMYARAFPALLGLIALVMGSEAIPAHLLRLIPSPYAEEALAAAEPVLSPHEHDRLARRLGVRPAGATGKTHATRSAPVESAEPHCTVRLFGGFEVHTERGPLRDRDWAKRKARLLFAMLVSRLGKDVPREQLVEYLWPEMSEQQALNNFYVVWSAMKRALSPGSSREDGCPYVEHVRGVCRVRPGRVDSDLEAFERNLVVARKARTAGDPDSELAALTEVAEIYRGELLPGDLYDDWFSGLRERCRHDFEDAMLRAAEITHAKGSAQDALSLLRRAMQHDPWREDLYQAALRMQIDAGQRSAAIETYMLCRQRLVEDLGIDPSRETSQLYEQVLGMEE